MRSYLERTGVVGVAAAALLAWPSFAAEGPYHFLKEITIGGEGGWDYLSVDTAVSRPPNSRPRRAPPRVAGNGPKSFQPPSRFWCMGSMNEPIRP